MQPIITVLATFHREGSIAYAAMRSVILAMEQAALHGVQCRIMVVIDRGDDSTRQWVYRFEEHLDDLFEVDFGNVSSARNHGISHITTKYLATLDGDDIFDRDWLWKGVQYLEEIGEDNVVGHTQMRPSFGSEMHGRLHISTGSHLFHPLNLIASWHYAADMIVPTQLYKALPLQESHLQDGLGAEDWLWTCESIVEGVRHIVVPETTCFYRRQADHISLGSIPGTTYPRTRLLDKHRLAGFRDIYPSTGTEFAECMQSPVGALEQWDKVPQWAKSAVRRACELDLSIYDLHKEIDNISFETPLFFPAVGHLYRRLMTQLLDDRSTVVFFSGPLCSQNLSLIDGFLLAYRQCRTEPLNVLVVTLAKYHHSIGNSPCSDNAERSLPEMPFLNLQHIDLGGNTAFNILWEHQQQDLIVRFLMQAAPELVVNIDSNWFDNTVAGFGRAIRSEVKKLVRICPGRDLAEEDKHLLENWRNLIRAKCNYSIALCQNNAIADALNAAFFGTETTFTACGGSREPGKNLLFGEKLIDLLYQSPSAAADDSITEPPENGAPTALTDELAADDIDITCILSVRDEGHGLNQILRAAAAMARDAADHGLNTEYFIVTSGNCPRTRRILKALDNYLPSARLIEPEFDNEAEAYNNGIAAARGRFIAIVPGAEMISPQWLTKAVQHAEAQGPDSIIHPHAFVEVSDNLEITYLPDMDNTGTNLEDLAFNNIWPGPVLAQTRLFQRIAYLPSTAVSGYGHIMWHWNCETVMAGCRHLSIQTTAAYRRSKTLNGGSEVSFGTIQKTTLAPSKFFTQHAWLQQPGKQARADGSNLFQAGLALGWIQSAINSAKSICTTFCIMLVKIGPFKTFAKRCIPTGWDEEAYLAAYPDVSQAIATGGFLSGFEHYWVHGRKQGRKDCHTLVLSDWLTQDTNLFSSFDPALRAASHQSRATHALKPTLAGHIYRSCWKIVSAAQPTHIILTAALRPGGAELSNFKIIESALANSHHRVMVITTDDDDNRWQKRLPEGCTWLPFHALAINSSMEEKTEVLTRLLLNSGVRCLHVSHSWLGWKVLIDHTPAIADRMRIFVSVFSLPGPEIDGDPGYARFLTPLVPYLTGLFTDNQQAANAFESVCGVPKNIISVLRHSVTARHRFSGPSKENKIVLWAGRIDVHKRPELLMQIAGLLPAVKFHVYGTSVLDDGGHLKRLLTIPNIEYQGSFAGFDTIRTAAYGLFLYTATWDGLPNVLLEAMKSGLLVIAPDVGGIAEVVNDDTGILIKEHNDPAAYANAIEQAFENTTKFHKIAATGSKRISDGFTDTAFVESMKKVKGYL